MIVALILLLVIPLALARDYFCAKHLGSKKGIAGCFGVCLLVFFLVDAVVLETFIEDSKE